MVMDQLDEEGEIPLQPFSNSFAEAEVLLLLVIQRHKCEKNWTSVAY